MRYGLAVLACVGIFFVYAMIGVALGWRGGGGFIPTLILFAILGVTWRAITKSGQAKADPSGQEDKK